MYMRSGRGRARVCSTSPVLVLLFETRTGVSHEYSSAIPISPLCTYGYRLFTIYRCSAVLTTGTECGVERSSSRFRQKNSTSDVLKIVIVSSVFARSGYRHPDKRNIKQARPRNVSDVSPSFQSWVSDRLISHTHSRCRSNKCLNS